MSLNGSTDKIKVVHLSSVHQASDTRIFVKECQSLVKAGYDVTLIAAADSDQDLEGVKIVAVAKDKTHRFKRMTITVVDVYRKAREIDGQVYHFHDPELIPIGLLLKFHGKRVIYDVHESVTKQILSKPWLPRLTRRPVAMLYGLIEKFATRYFDAIICATPAIAAQFPTNRTVVVHNFAMLGELSSIDITDYRDREGTLCYIGGISISRGLREMTTASCAVAQVDRLLLAGHFQPESLRQELETWPTCKNIEFLGVVDRHGVKEILAKARIGLVLLHPEPNYLESYPVKIFEYMAAGIPVIASHFPNWQAILDGAGITVDPSDIEEICDAIERLLSNSNLAMSMGLRGRELVISKYNWEQESIKLTNLYSQIT